jgi:hypothetical protein
MTPTPSSRGRVIRRLITCLAVAMAVPATVAVANHIDSMFPTQNFNSACTDGGHYCQTDNATLTVYRQGSLSSTGIANIGDTLNNSYDTTVLSVSYAGSSVSYTGSAETDIIYQQNASRVPSGEDGWTWCDDAVSSTRCDQHYVAFRLATPYIELACHETGHAVGLTHGNDAYPAVSIHDNSLACMTTHPIESRWLGTHNTQEINYSY